MPFRLDEMRTKIQFLAPAWMPSRIYQACLAVGAPSNTRYIQEAVCERLARDLGLDLQALLDDLPQGRNNLYDPDVNPMARPGNTNAVSVDFTGGRIRIGPGNTVEEVR